MPEIEVVGTPVQLADEEVGLVRRLAEARAAQSQWKKIEAELKKELRLKIDAQGTNMALTASGAPAFYIRYSVREAPDKDKLEALYPEVYAAVLVETTVETLVIDDSLKS